MTAAARRSRSRNNGKSRSNGNGGGIRPQTVFTSHGPEGRVRGTAVQISDKYLGLAHDASTSGNKVLAQSYYQHAEHYSRLVNKMNENREASRRQREEDDLSAQDQPEVKAKHENKKDASEQGNQDQPQAESKPKPKRDRKSAANAKPDAEGTTADTNDDAPKRRGRPRKAKTEQDNNNDQPASLGQKTREQMAAVE